MDLSAELLASVANSRVIYFDFDSDAVKPEYQDTVAKHANRLTKDKKVNLLLEGHRRARWPQYNLALGQRRAESVAKSLTLLGASGGWGSSRSASARSAPPLKAAMKPPGPRTAASN